MRTSGFLSSVLFLCCFAVPAFGGSLPSAVSLSSAANSTNYGQPVVLTASVSPSAATGNVMFYDGVSIIGVQAVSNGAATIRTTVLGTGTHSIIARYNGDTSYAPS